MCNTLAWMLNIPHDVLAKPLVSRTEWPSGVVVSVVADRDGSDRLLYIPDDEASVTLRIGPPAFPDFPEADILQIQENGLYITAEFINGPVTRSSESKTYHIVPDGKGGITSTLVGTRRIYSPSKDGTYSLHLPDGSKRSTCVSGAIFSTSSSGAQSMTYKSGETYVMPPNAQVEWMADTGSVMLTFEDKSTQLLTEAGGWGELKPPPRRVKKTWDARGRDVLAISKSRL